MAILITDIQEKRVGNPKSAPATFDVAHIPSGRHQSQQINDIVEGNETSTQQSPQQGSQGQSNQQQPPMTKKQARKKARQEKRARKQAAREAAQREIDKRNESNTSPSQKDEPAQQSDNETSQRQPNITYDPSLKITEVAPEEAPKHSPLEEEDSKVNNIFQGPSTVIL